jgi:hypothetical protein
MVKFTCPCCQEWWRTLKEGDAQELELKRLEQQARNGTIQEKQIPYFIAKVCRTNSHRILAAVKSILDLPGDYGWSEPSRHALEGARVVLMSMDPRMQTVLGFLSAFGPHQN